MGNGFVDQPGFSSPGELIKQDMTHVMDKALYHSMLADRLTPALMDSFKIHGRWFEHFLAFNGFSVSLNKRLEMLELKEAKIIVEARDDEGNDLLLAAIKSKNIDVVRAVLKVSSAHINTPVPKHPDYYSVGNTPLVIARKWRVSEEIIKLLQTYGAK
jgi:hypothetical protein